MNRGDSKTYGEAMEFHGHSCPGLALGFRVALKAMEWLNANRAEDEEIVALVENDSCAVDAIQVVTGCTFGKGNLLFRDIGKRVYTFCSRSTGKGIRIVENYAPFESSQLQELRKAVFGGTATEEQRMEFQDFFKSSVEEILAAPVDRLFSFAEVKIPIPPRARLFDTLTCSRCGEKVMEPRAMKTGVGVFCADCAEHGLMHWKAAREY
jgi:formylmethanofuran dehydrogenase subunit E